MQTVIVTPVLLSCVLLVVQVALWFHSAQLADHAAADGAAAAARYGATDRDGSAAAQALVADAGARLLAVPAVERGDGAVAVTVRVRVPRVVPGWPTEVQRRAAEPLERIVPEDRR